MCACTVDNPLAKARGLSLRTGAQSMLYLSLVDKLDTRKSNKTISNEFLLTKKGFFTRHFRACSHFLMTGFFILISVRQEVSNFDGTVVVQGLEIAINRPL